MNQIIILAGGKGTRMKSETPKVLTKINRKPLLFHLLDNIKKSFPNPALVVGYKGDEIIEATKNKYSYIWQRQQLGTGHAIKCAKKELVKKDFDNIIVIPGDHPLVSAQSLDRALKEHKLKKATITLITAKVPNYKNDYESFFNCGRIVKNKKGEIVKITELKDADEDCQKIKELNLSCYCFSAQWLWQNIDKIKNNNKAKEYYLTDLIEMAVSQKKRICSVNMVRSIEGLGVNNLDQLKIVKKYINKNK